MQGVAYKSSLAFVERVFWIVPALLLTRQGDWSVRAIVLSSIATGVVWQLVYRRDLADRLVFLALAAVVPVCFLVIDPAETGEPEPLLTLGIVFLVFGLVVTEQVLRVREDRRALREARKRGSVPAGP